MRWSGIGGGLLPQAVRPPAAGTEPKRRTSHTSAAARSNSESILNSNPSRGRELPASAAPTVPASGIAQLGQPKVVAAMASDAPAPAVPAAAPLRARYAATVSTMSTAAREALSTSRARPP